MRRLPPVELGQLFAYGEDARAMWRVARLLGDRIHVVLVRRDDPTRQKTVSIWALGNQRLFMPVTEAPLRQAGE
jgi:hypothetical protein